MQTGVCDESDSVVRIATDRESGGLIVMVYLAHFDHAVWTMSRHIEAYLIRQFKGLYGIPVHSVHMNVVRARAFKEMPPIKSSSSMRAVLRERRSSRVQSTGTTGRRIVHAPPKRSQDDAFPATGHMGLEELPATKTRARPEADPALSRSRSPKANLLPLITEEYLSVPGYEVSEVDFEEFLNSMPGDSSLPPGVIDSRQAPDSQQGQALQRGPKPGAPSTFLAETDLMKQERK